MSDGEGMKKLYLQVKIFLVYWLIRFKIRPNVWHKCEIDLARVRAARLSQFLKDIDNQRLHLTKGVKDSDTL